MSLTEAINDNGAKCILFLQNAFPYSGLTFMQISNIGDPSLAFTFYFPVAAGLSLSLGSSLLWTLIICEWSNMILKWVLAGDRPFWWIHETPLYHAERAPSILQYPLTCETGPGMPSGHSALNAALFFVLTRALTSYLKGPLTSVFNESISRRIRNSVWVMYGVWVGLVMLARTYFAAHFPHQCLAGALIGILVAVWVNSTKVFAEMTRKKAICITASIFITVGSVFAAYTLLGNDPMWSVNKAIRWCIRKEYIHVDSKPFYSLSRFSGQTLGLGLALSSPHYAKASNSRFTWKMKLSLLILALATGQSSAFIHKLLPSSITGYYAMEFLQNVTMVYLVIALLPNFVAVASGVVPKQKARMR